MPSPPVAQPRYFLLGSPDDVSEGLGGSVSGQNLIITDVEVGKFIIINYYIANPSSYKPDFSSVSGAEIVHRVKRFDTSKYIETGSLVCLATNTKIIVYFLYFNSAASTMFSAYQV